MIKNSALVEHEILELAVVLQYRDAAEQVVLVLRHQEVGQTLISELARKQEAVVLLGHGFENSFRAVNLLVLVFELLVVNLRLLRKNHHDGIEVKFERIYQLVYDCVNLVLEIEYLLADGSGVGAAAIVLVFVLDLPVLERVDD